MKKIGYLLIAIGLGLFFYLVVNLINEQNRIHSPIPDEEGIKVIQITPSK